MKNVFKMSSSRRTFAGNTLNDLSNQVCVPNKTRFNSKRVQYGYRNK